MEAKLDKIIQNQEYITKLLESIVEHQATHKKPDFKKMMEPLLNNPLFKDNPMISKAMGDVFDSMGGNND